MVYTRFCQCGRILTIEEMDKEKNPSGVCKKCQEEHAQNFHNRYNLKSEKEKK